LEISEAYNHLSDYPKRNIYDVTLSGEIKPNVAHNIYDSYNTLRENEGKALQNLHPTTQYAESTSISSYTQKTPQGVLGKTVTHKSSVENGQKLSTTTEETLNPDGSKTIVETVHNNGRAETKKYSLAAGEKRENRKEIKAGEHHELHHDTRKLENKEHKEHKDQKEHKEEHKDTKK